MDEEADGSLTCVGEMRVRTTDDRVQEKLFILRFPQQALSGGATEQQSTFPEPELLSWAEQGS